MPTYKKKTYKKSYKKKFNRSSNLLKTDSAQQQVKKIPLGKTFTWSTRYTAMDIQINPTIGGFADSYVFSLNGLYDTDISGTGHQPIGFDQMMLMYNHYTVVSAKVNVQYIGTDTTYPIVVGMYVTGNSTEESYIEKVIENGQCIYRLIPPAGQASNIGTLKANYNISKELGISNILSEADARGTNASNPAEQLYLHIIAEPMGSEDALPVKVLITIDYLVILTEPKLLNGS